MFPVYEQESQPSKHFTLSMGSAPLAESTPHTMPEPSNIEAASDSSPAPPTKRQGHPRWPKKIVVKEKFIKNAEVPGIATNSVPSAINILSHKKN